MNRFLLLLLLFCSCFAETIAQEAPAIKDSQAIRGAVPDSIKRTDSLVQRLDSLHRVAVKPAFIWGRDTARYVKVLAENRWFNFNGKAVIRTIIPRNETGKEGVFYLLMALFLLLALIRSLFGRYFQNLFTVFFRASMKQKQIREQLLQAPLASLLLNLLFVGTGGLLVTLVLSGSIKGEDGPIPFWWIYGYSITALAVLYFGKYFFLKMLGWTLKMEATTDTYIFIVFMCNKVLAIMLLPLLLVFAFANPELSVIAQTICYVLVAGILAYRYISSYGYINREVRTSRFHFFLYLCAFEVAPLLLIYKVLLKFV